MSGADPPDDPGNTNAIYTCLRIAASHSRSRGELEVIRTENDHVLCYIRRYLGQHAIILANFADSAQRIPSRLYEQCSLYTKKILHGSSKVMDCHEIIISPLDFLVLR
jgi:hypothetical protein